MLLEKSMQARFLIPMAMALAYGVVFATVVILLLVPAVYLIVDDVKRLLPKNMRWIIETPEPDRPKTPAPEGSSVAP